MVIIGGYRYSIIKNYSFIEVGFQSEVYFYSRSNKILVSPGIMYTPYNVIVISPCVRIITILYNMLPRENACVSGERKTKGASGDIVTRMFCAEQRLQRWRQPHYRGRLCLHRLGRMLDYIILWSMVVVVRSMS